MKSRFTSAQEELLTVVIEGGGERVEEAGHHIHSKAILSRTCEPGKILVHMNLEKYWLKMTMHHLPISAQLA